MNASAYREKNHLPLQAQFDKLWIVCMQLREYAPPELIDQLEAAFTELQEATKANLRITKAGSSIGFGVNKVKKTVACDTAIAIIRQIKALKAW